MKKVSNLLVGVFLVGAAYAQENKDTVPNVSNGSKPLSTIDTTPGLRTDPSFRRDTVSWNKDSLKRKNWNDTIAATGTTAPLGGERTNQDIKDTTGTVAADAAKWKDNKETKMKENEADTTPTTTTVKAKKPVKDRVMMKDGEMVIIKNGKETKLAKSIKLPDGNIVMTDGTIKMPDGNSVKLKDGEYINLKPGKGK